MHRTNGPLLLLTLALALAPGLAAAQLTLKQAAGVTFSDVTRDPQSGQASGKVGWQAGGTALLGELLYLEAGAFYARKSTTITAASQGVDFGGLTGLRVPVVVGYHLIGDARGFLSVRAFGGASAFFVTAVDGSGLARGDLGDPTYGVLAGVGLDVAFLFADLSSEWSLTDLSTLETVDVGASRAPYLNVGLKFPL